MGLRRIYWRFGCLTPLWLLLSRTASFNFQLLLPSSNSILWHLTVYLGINLTVAVAVVSCLTFSHPQLSGLVVTPAGTPSPRGSHIIQFPSSGVTYPPVSACFWLLSSALIYFLNILSRVHHLSRVRNYRL